MQKLNVFLPGFSFPMWAGWYVGMVQRGNGETLNISVDHRSVGEQVLFASSVNAWSNANISHRTSAAQAPTVYQQSPEHILSYTKLAYLLFMHMSYICCLAVPNKPSIELLAGLSADKGVEKNSGWCQQPIKLKKALCRWTELPLIQTLKIPTDTITINHH